MQDITNYNNTLYKKLESTKIFASKKIKYGTSGFRYNASVLEYISFRCGIFVGLISKKTSPKFWGMVLTASHNGYKDNGVKIIDTHSHLLSLENEKILEKFVNNRNFEESLADLKSDLKIEEYGCLGFVFLGHDTRDSAGRLVDSFVEGVRFVKSEFVNLKFVTTPQVYFYVQYKNNFLDNKLDLWNEKDLDIFKSYYFEFFSKQFNDIKKLLEKKKKNVKEKVFFDCSKGIGAFSIVKFDKSCLFDFIDLEIINKKGKVEELNHLCGAEHVHKKSLAPVNLSENAQYGVSLDGDADRIIYFNVITKSDGENEKKDQDNIKIQKDNINDKDNKNKQISIEVIDGDKMIAIQVKCILKILKKLVKIEDFSMAVVITQYSNYALVNYLKKKNVNIIITPTGVKYTHIEAMKYDVGIYFESNGHGTLMIKEKFLEKIKTKFDLENQEQLLAWKILNFRNNYTGDAVFNFLQIELFLKYLNFSKKQFARIFEYKKHLTYKLKVKNKENLICDEIKAEIIKPVDLRTFIEKICEEFKKYDLRIYIRASGTEDVLRVHLEWDGIDCINEVKEKIDEFLKNNEDLN